MKLQKQQLNYTNHDNVSLLMAAWLAEDGGYDYKPSEFEISATTIIKPIKSLVLSSYVHDKGLASHPDVMQNRFIRFGTAVHSAVENTWDNHREKALRKLGYSDEYIARIKVNPNPDELEPEDIPVYQELRGEKKIGNWTVSGKFDCIMGGQIRDIKTCWSNKYSDKRAHEEFSQQGSIYRWLFPDLADYHTIAIDYVFVDWHPGMAAQQGKPPLPIMTEEYPIMGPAKTEAWLGNRLKQLEGAMRLIQEDISNQNQLPRCTPFEIKQQVHYKYFSKPDNVRATKNFKEDAGAAYAYRDAKGTGDIRTVHLEPKMCNYCAGRYVCKQAQEYVAAGLLEIT